MKQSAEQMFKLLPGVVRLRDAQTGGALEDFIELLWREANRVERDITQTWDNWFIETCEEWVAPYIGDLLAVRPLHSIEGAFTQRARIANTIRFRRRKGTATMLEQLARDTTGWPARAVEFFQLLSTTQYAKHIRLHNHRTPDVRDANRMELIETPFGSAAHTADVRRIATGRGRYNLPNIGIFLWRLEDYAIRQSTARPTADAGCYHFHPLGIDVPLFNRERAESSITHLAREIDVPGPLRRRPLYAEVEALRSGATPETDYLSADPVFEVWLDGQRLNPKEIAICDLSDPPAAIPTGWYRPPSSKPYPAGNQTIRAGVDPKLGRLALPEGDSATRVEVSYSEGFSGDVGAHVYDRRAFLAAYVQTLGRTVDWQAGVTEDQAVLAASPNPAQMFPSVSAALTAFGNHLNTNPNAFGLIAIMDSRTYQGGLTVPALPPGAALAIVAAGWPVSGNQRITGEFDPRGLRPHILGGVTLEAQPSAAGQRATVLLDGLLIEGAITVDAGDMGDVHIAHSTTGPITANASNLAARLRLTRAITGPITLAGDGQRLEAADSIIASNAAGDPAAQAVAADAGDVTFESATVFGTVKARRIDASNTIFTGVATAARLQAGCVRYSHVPAGSQTAQRFRCQPDIALQEEKNAANHPSIRLRLTPAFTSTRLGDPGYAQLAPWCAPEIRTGADDASEMGVFRYLKNPQRESNLRVSLDEYLRLGLEAGTFFLT